MRNDCLNSNGLPSTSAAPSAFFGVRAPFYEPPDVSAGSGGAPSSSSGDGTAGSGAGGDAAAGGNVPQSYRLTDDSMVDLGDGKPMKWSEARSTRFMDRSSYDKGVEFLRTMAVQMDARDAAARSQGQRGQQRQQQQQQGQQGQQGNVDPFASIEDMAVIDGRTLAKIARELQSNGMQPLGKLVASMGARMQQLESQLGTVQKTTGTLAERESNTEFDGFIGTALKAMPEIKGLGSIPLDNPAVQEFAKDLFLSHDQADPTLRRDFGKMLTDRVTGLFDLFTTMQKNAVTQNRERVMARFRPGGNATPGSGKPAFKMQSGSEIAREFFGGQEART